MTLRSTFMFSATFLLAACSSARIGQSVLPPNAESSISRAAGATGTLVVRIRVAGRQEKPDYISSATKGMTVAVTGPTTFKKTVGLVTNAKGCKSKLMTLECTLAIPGLKACPKKKHCYTGTVVTYDAFDKAHNRIPPGAHKLSAEIGFGFRIAAGTTLIPLVLEGIPAAVAFLPNATSALNGNQMTGFTLPKCTTGAQTASIVGLDAAGNYIVGAGAPKVALSSDDQSQLAVSNPSPSTPNTFTLAPPVAPAYAFGNHTIHLTAQARPGPKSRGATQSAQIPVTYSGDICGTFDEFSVPTASGRPWGITVGPDGALWFTELFGNKIGRITTTGTITEFGGLVANSHPLGIATGSDGNLWFAQANIDTISRITTAGIVSSFTTPTVGSNPIDVIRGPDGNLWFTEFLASKIGKITTSGGITEYPTTTAGSQPYEITTGPDNNLWFTECNANKIGLITVGGAVSEYPIPTAASGAVGIVSGLDGNLWFGEFNSGRVGRSSTSGNIVEFPLPTISGEPFGAVEGPDGAVWFAELGGSKVARVTAGGAASEYLVPTSASGVSNFTVGPDGALWFTEQFGNKIGRLR